MNKVKFKKGDLVKVIAGKHKGTEGPIIRVLREKSRVVIEGITNIKHVKPSQDNTEGGIQQVPASVHISNVALIDPKNKKEITKISYQIADNGKKVRIARKSKAHLA
ncbi:MULTISPECIES: 50S ribosomal protein L24 [Spiroplasma]|uniref:Large ribosomal subunit protein uL24 n=4 Tax=Spiroplasma TaxID=2132 RepID=RL24_SPIKU|nr:MULTISPECIES: 50S ribosomal protein L24 [Spiroplasma]P60745.1 RecName: Full=Large ribosomal subunit protein uL24; AltName: Full=50S ribosomal protein L24 [Spiroplasma kunkelii]AAP58902.1 ribosomal protein L24 [Spiroplasma kunkelii CR2-3x]ALA97174.1 50S ribosomal protein L24 [Spiroplasma kunkelii CR2-3x]ELL44427.1 50S ribosomal protein L24 [Spiroplasma melliferum IPMB4A]KAI92093.1 50S ribosomal protein L24 [Spiroplasma melliferum KC3]QCO23505.1 50S ribosomal protein L24 [Spiroplasma mellife